VVAATEVASLPKALRQPPCTDLLPWFQMTTQHPITPPPELVREWRQEHTTNYDLARQAARWGADQQLAMDANWLDHNALNEPHLQVIPMGESLKEAMRLKRPNLKEQALIELNDVYNRDKIDDVTYDTILRALEALDD